MTHSDDPRQLLETEARIIIENDRYAVVALRLDKAIIANNLPFLVALAQLAPRFIDQTATS